MSGVIHGARVARLADGQALSAWSREAVAARLAQAARTLRALPSTDCFPRGLGAHWPEVVRGFWEIWNALEGEAERKRYVEERNRRAAGVAVPTAAAIDAMDAALRWLAWVPDRRHVRVAWALALGIRPGRLSRELGISRQTVRCWQRDALETIVQRLNRQTRPDYE